MLASFGAGIGIGLLNRNRQDAVNLTMGMGSDAALALAGIRLNITGEAHLWSDRPAVFIFNHQSILDGFVVMKLLRQNVTGVAKKEVAKQPGFGQFARLANMAFIDRGNTRGAKQALAPVVERMREGYSIAIAPEGTRSATPAVGKFKKGAFHMAMQGEVPIVPIVIRNAGQLLWRGSTFMRSGTLDVAVLPPISVADWTAEDLNERVAEVRQLFVSTLARWPSRAVAREVGSDHRPNRRSLCASRTGGVIRASQVTVLGAGSWGTTVASLAAANTSTVLWARDADLADEIDAEHRNSRYLGELELNPDLRATASLQDAVEAADVLVMGVPSAGMRAALECGRAVRSPLGAGRQSREGPGEGNPQAAERGDRGGAPGPSGRRTRRPQPGSRGPGRLRRRGGHRHAR